MSKFLVTGFGRSGTKWLAGVLGCQHEPIRCQDANSINTWIDAAPDGYGQVNSYCLAALPQVHCDRKLLLIRHPRQILTSCHYWGHTINPAFVQYLGQSLVLIDDHIQRHRYVRLEHLTKDMLMLATLMDWLGVKVTGEALDKTHVKVNASGRKDDSVLTFSPEVEAEIGVNIDWFTRRYYQ